MDMKHPAWRIPSTIAITNQRFEKQDKDIVHKMFMTKHIRLMTAGASGARALVKWN